MNERKFHLFHFIVMLAKAFWCKSRKAYERKNGKNGKLTLKIEKIALNVKWNLKLQQQ